MLKIKDNIDLKELEKFGFTKTYITDDEEQKAIEYNRTKYIDRPTRLTWQRVHIDCKTRKITFWNVRNICFNKNWANDLISAGLVEKVVE